MKFKLNKTLSISSFAAASVIFASGCVSIPEQTSIVNQSNNLDSSISYNKCDTSQTKSYSDISRKSAHELNSQSITLLNWNIYKGERKNWAADFRQLSDNQDLLIIQEARLSEQVKETLKKQSINWTMNTGFFINEEATGVLTGSKVKPVSSCGLRTTEPFLRLPKTVLINQYELSDTKLRLLVANIHSINFTLGTAVYSAQIEALKAAIKNHQGPVILAGDFNSWNDNRKQIIEKMVDDLSLKTVTYKSKNRITIFGNEIDHVFYRGLVALSSEARQVTSSDHNPIKVTFRVSPAKHKIARF